MPAEMDMILPVQGIGVIYTDTRTDLYRAGRAAAILAAADGETGAAIPEILLFRDVPNAEETEAFTRGLSDGGWIGEPRFITAGEAGAQTAAVSVLTGKAQGYFRENPRGPVILFSWIDPALTPRNAALVFDDSPWALLKPALSMLEKGPASGEFSIPSVIRVKKGKILEKSIYNELNSIITLKFSGQFADN
jgi:hypothetical protein